MSAEAGRPVAERPLTAKGRATRARVLKVAADLMFEHGAAATSIDDVKRAAKVSASQVGYYFGDKQSLVRAVIEYQAETLIEGQRPLLDRLDSFEALHAWRDYIVAMRMERQYVGGCPVGSLASELADSSPALREDIAAAFLRWREPIAAGLAAMRDRGELRSEADPETLSMALLAAVEGGTLLAQTLREVAPLEAVLDAVLAHVHSLS